MSDPVARRQGQPVLFLGLLLAGWCLVRIVTWQNPWPDTLPLPDSLRFAGSDLRPADREAGREGALPVRALPEDRTEMLPVVPAWEQLPPAYEPLELPSTMAPVPSDGTEHFDTHRRAVGHNLLFAAGMASLPMPRAVSALLEGSRRTIPPRSPAVPLRYASPWRVDGWVVLREGRSRLVDVGTRPSSYGASQLGAVLSYDLAPGTARAPAAYARATRALVEGGETEGAVGLRFRPIANFPLAAHAEVRVTERPGRPAEIRPAAFAAGGFEQVSLPARIRARGYGQAGYVGGDFATPFVDGSIVAEREMARFSLGRVSVGGGIWGGAQKGATRLDLGPSVTVDLRLGATPARIEADYRWRIAGDATPGDGGVLTLSTGF